MLNNCNCIYCCYDPKANSNDHANKKNKNQNSNCNVISNLLLPEDLMFYAFALVPLSCLLNSARYVCKSWAAVIHSPRFVEAYEQRRPCSKLGLYVENLVKQGRSYFLEFNDDVIGPFERFDLGIPKNLGYIISTCDGLLFLSSNCGQFFVVNPILKCCLKIPPTPISQKLLVVSSRCTIARVPRTAKFKLFLLDVLEISGDFWYVFYVLRIGIDNSWKEIARKEAPRNWVLSWEPLYRGGNDLYWITIDDIIVMDVDREIIVGKYPLPSAPMPGDRVPIFLSMGNHLSCIAYKDEIYEAYQIYILDFDSGKWSLYHEMGHFDYLAACGHELNNLSSVVFRFWVNDQIIFRVTRPRFNLAYMSPDKFIHFGYNVKTKQLTCIEGIDAEGSYELWLHTNSLVSLSSTQHS